MINNTLYERMNRIRDLNQYAPQTTRLDARSFHMG